MTHHSRLAATIKWCPSAECRDTKRTWFFFAKPSVASSSQSVNISASMLNTRYWPYSTNKQTNIKQTIGNTVISAWYHINKEQFAVSATGMKCRRIEPHDIEKGCKMRELVGEKSIHPIINFLNINQRSLVLNNGTYQNIVCACISFAPQHFSTLRANSCELLYCLHSFVQFNCGKRKESKQFFFVVRYLKWIFWIINTTIIRTVGWRGDFGTKFTDKEIVPHRKVKDQSVEQWTNCEARQGILFYF